MLWVTRKSIEVDVKWVQKKEELVKETKESKINKTYYITNAIF